MRQRAGDERRGNLQPAVTDLGLYPNGSALDDGALADLIDECQGCDELFLSVGLTKNWDQNRGHVAAEQHLAVSAPEAGTSPEGHSKWLAAAYP